MPPRRLGDVTMPPRRRGRGRRRRRHDAAPPQVRVPRPREFLPRTTHRRCAGSALLRGGARVADAHAERPAGRPRQRRQDESALLPAARAPEPRALGAPERGGGAPHGGAAARDASRFAERVAGCDAPPPPGISASQPRRRRDSSPRNCQLAAAASPRCASAEYPRPGRGVAATRLHGLAAASTRPCFGHRRRRTSSSSWSSRCIGRRRAAASAGAA